jgi:16S rRNA (guanine527-N7)-methyltransferase
MALAVDNELAAALERLLPAYTAEVRGKVAALFDLHTRYRERARLSAPLTPGQYAVHFLLDSLNLLELASPAAGASLADVGSGGGYPGLPLAIARPDLRITLIEPAPRKAEYLRLAAERLALTNVTVAACSVENWPGGMFDVVTAKAFRKPLAALKTLWPLVKRGGRAVLFLGPSAAAAELALREGARGLGGRVAASHHYELPGYERPRLLVAVVREGD